MAFINNVAACAQNAGETITMNENGRILWIDATRILAIFGVVLLHTAAPYLDKFEGNATADWNTANIIDAITRPSVPLFFMVSGALLIERSIGISQLKPRLKRLIVPLLAWSIIYLIMRAITEPNFNLVILLVQAPLMPVMYHLWFLYALIGIYLCLPLVAPAIQAASPMQLRYGLGLWVLASAMLPTFEWISGAKSSIELSTMAGFMGYMVMGHVLAKAPRPSRKQAFAAMASIGIGYGITVFGTIIMTVHQGKFFGKFYDYLSPNVMLFSAGVFVIMRVVFEGRQSRLAKGLSDLSFGIYLCHVAVRAVVAVLLDVRGWGVSGIVPYAVLTFAISAIGVFVVRRLGLAKILAP